MEPPTDAEKYQKPVQTIPDRFHSTMKQTWLFSFQHLAWWFKKSHTKFCRIERIALASGLQHKYIQDEYQLCGRKFR